MSLPDKNDPARPLALAARSTRLLGILSIAIGLFVVITGGYLNPLHHFRPYFFAGGLLGFILPGTIFLICAAHLPRRSRTAVGFGMAMTVFQLLCAIATFIASITLQPVSPIPIILAIFWILALAQLIWHLWRSLESIALDTSLRHGFALSTNAPRPVLPVTLEVPVEPGNPQNT
jgi:MFS family permease